MKRIASICIFILFAFSLAAQTKKPVVFGDALAKNRKMQRAGTILTVVGGATFFAGNLMYWNIYNQDGSDDASENKVNTSVNVMIGGLGLMAVGIPLLVIGKTNERGIKIEANLFKYNKTASLPGIGFKIRF